MPVSSEPPCVDPTCSQDGEPCSRQCTHIAQVVTRHDVREKTCKENWDRAGVPLSRQPSVAGLILTRLLRPTGGHKYTDDHCHTNSPEAGSMGISEDAAQPLTLAKTTSDFGGLVLSTECTYGCRFRTFQQKPWSLVAVCFTAQ